MNVAQSVADGTELVTIGGEQALCDRRGALHFTELGLLVVSDLHLEKGSSLARRGRLIPPYDTAATLARLGEAIRQYRPQTVISLGDSFHDPDGAGRLPGSFRESLLQLMTGRQWFWIAGNHDPAPPKDLPGETVHELALGRLTFRHEPSAVGPSDGEIAGHLHPGARIVRRGRSVRRACFASDGRRLVMPAFGSFTGTLNVLDDAFAALFSRDSLTAYMLGRDRVYAIGGANLRPG